MRTGTIPGPMEKRKHCSNSQKRWYTTSWKLKLVPCSKLVAKYLSVSFLMTCLTNFFVCINQVFSMSFVYPTTYIPIIHEIYKVFGRNFSLEVQGVFLDISETFDKFWNEGLLCNVKRNGIIGDLLKLIESSFIRQIPESCIKWSKLQLE